ncbi:MAG: CehA/McbA family metallohydrolase [Gemmataceae bacterium]
MLPLLLLLCSADLARPAVERQPLAAQAKRVAAALELAGAPLPAADARALADAKTSDAIQAVLDRRCLFAATLGKDGKSVTLAAGPAEPELAEQGWRVFLVKVFNPGGVENQRLALTSPNAQPLTRRSTSRPDPTVVSVGEVSRRFLDLEALDRNPMTPALSGLEVEYRLVSLYCRDSGRKEAALRVRLGDGGKGNEVLSNELTAVFDSKPAVLVKLKVVDHDGKMSRDGRPVMASFTFRDDQGRVHPSPARRLAPDFNFHFQVYRGDGESIALQPGKYHVTYTRGPEYRVLTRTIDVPAGRTHAETFELKRWVHLARKGWWSGDHHIHAAGCSHYESPTEGVTPEDMMRHVEGEDLNVGCCLSWGPCWYHQKRYFDGKVHRLSTPNHLLRYDVEVSGFPSSHAGHICLLRLREQEYPGTKLISDWPSWDLPIFKWAKQQGGVVGFAHTGWGLDVGPTRELPNYLVPPMNSIGANEYLVDVALGQCDFLSTVDTPAIWELNIWYHTLNCGFRPRVSGETDFPCIYGERVGIGRSYVHLGDRLDFDGWVEGIKTGRCYVSDGKSHLIDFTANGLGVGLKGSEVKLDRPGTVALKASVAALLEPEPTAATEKIRSAPWSGRPYWDLERVHVGKTRKVPVEVVVNGVPVATKEVEADGTEHAVAFDVKVQKSSWVALRVLGSSHTNPVWVTVDGKPVRASRKSAEWCLKGIDKCWEQKRRAIRPAERAEAEKAYDEARAVYRRVAAESVE